MTRDVVWILGQHNMRCSVVWMLGLDDKQTRGWCDRRCSAVWTMVEAAHNAT